MNTLRSLSQRHPGRTKAVGAVLLVTVLLAAIWLTAALLPTLLNIIS